MNQSDQINELAVALAQAQSEMEGAKKGAENPYFKSKYADLASVREASMPALNKHGLSIIQTMTHDESKIGVVTTLLHTSGQWIRGELAMTPAKADPQAIGSLITYFRRYSWQSIIGLSAEDDDGEKAMPREKKSTPKPEIDSDKGTDKGAMKPLTTGQGKDILRLGLEKNGLSDGEGRQVIDYYCGLHGRTYQSGEYIINHWSEVFDAFLEDYQQRQASAVLNAPKD